MNIFVTDEDPKISAQNLDDKRVVKMILESAQMLCTALHHNNASHLAKYKATHANHPCNVWCRESRENYYWLFRHFIALCSEYTHRYGKIHKSQQLANHLQMGMQHIPHGERTPFPNCAARSDMNIDFKHIDPVTYAYKLYLIERWLNDKVNPKWTNRTRPF